MPELIAHARRKEINRINKLAGNQARILLLWLLEKGHLDNIPYQDLKEGFEVAESYHPESSLKSF